MTTTATTMTAAEALAGLPELADWVPRPLRRWSVDEYEELVATGALSGRFHLINGLLVEKMTHHPPHATADEKLGKKLLRVVPEGWTVRSAKPVRLPGQASEPEPDRSVARGSDDDYHGRHPGAEDLGLVVEVSDSSLAEDRKLAAVYGAAGAPSYWIVNIGDRQVEVFSRPNARGYATVAVFVEGETVPVVLDGREIGRIAVADVLPPAPSPRAR